MNRKLIYILIAVVLASVVLAVCLPGGENKNAAPTASSPTPVPTPTATLTPAPTDTPAITPPAAHPANAASGSDVHLAPVLPATDTDLEE